MARAQLSTSDITSHDALAVVEKLGQSSSMFLALNEGNRYFSVEDRPGLIAYRPAGRRYWVQLTGACAADADRGPLDRAFADAARAARKRVIAVQLNRADAERAATADWVVNQFGCSYSIDLAQFSLRGQKFVKTRNMIARSRREGVTVSEAAADRLAVPEFAAQLDGVDAAWLRNKGRHVKELRLMIGERGGAMQNRRRLFVAEVDGRVVAYISYSPVYGERAGWLYDLTRRAPDAPPGVIEHVFSEAAQTFRDEKVGWLHLGLTPFVGLHPEHAVPTSSRLLNSALSLIGERGSALYPAKGQLAFKLKWRPQSVTPEYIAFPRRVRLRDVLCLALATNSL
ncbi:MAG: phosphatidylglycerol lysyltransferase domain-containing protein [Actinophytocola sp.]|uniref:phosphatidylglycerol lysyltransferase domain-containing protein n=1 Tax=Actinophytocola sp. TaxID=1872138 RepID=UPI003D6BDABB